MPIPELICPDNRIRVWARLVVQEFNRLEELVEGLSVQIEENVQVPGVDYPPVISAKGFDVTVDFGASFTNNASATVTGLPWVTTNSRIIVAPKTSGTDSDEIAALGFQWVVHSFVAGDGFTLTVLTEVEAKGTYTFSCIGI